MLLLLMMLKNLYFFFVCIIEKEIREDICLEMKWKKGVYMSKRREEKSSNICM